MGYLDWYLRLADPIRRAHEEGQPRRRPLRSPAPPPRAPRPLGDGEPSPFPFPTGPSGPPRQLWASDPGAVVGAAIGRAIPRPPPPPGALPRWTPEIAGEPLQTAPLFPSPGSPRVPIYGDAQSETGPIARAARGAGVPRQYLSALVGHESGGDPTADNPRSTARGHGQFIDSTWLAMMRANAARYGHPDIAEAIQERPGGKGLFVANPSMRAQILALRDDPQWAALMSAHYVRQNTQEMESRLGRRITEREAYLGHFLGSDDAVKLLEAAAANYPDARRFVRAGVPDANPEIFYNADGRPRSAREVVQLQGGNFRPDQVELAPMPQRAVTERDGRSPRREF